MFIALAAVVGALGFGLISFFKGGEFDIKYSNEAMRWRVLLQAIALGIFFLILWFGR
ncbi:twin transmembrane helix small protein [Candidatus Paracaedibacter symbiosus]|uniref:twin transmembrane helix small protein n=1 Tax=Candidatus Paracaedibacter symbiosus TaxID=244582 RepID=UPI000509C0D6|nr:twin transmembrane helix small protein [Candidatus Paracaedibacter symbiosus]